MQLHRQRLFLFWIYLTPSLMHSPSLLDVSACEHNDGHHLQLHGHSHTWTGSLRKSVNEDSNATVASVRRHLQDPSTGIEECGFVGLDEAAAEKDLQEFEEWKTNKSNFFEGSYYIPVYFHVIEPSANFVSDSRINYYMSYLKNSYAANTPFTFELKGITRTRNAAWSQSCRTYEMDYKNILKVGGMETLNIYICEAIPVDGGAWAGFAYFPTSAKRDGVVIAEKSTPVEIRPNTLVHEVGHYLGLPHTFNDKNTCDPDGDGIADTPRMISQAAKTNCYTTDPTLLDTCPSYPGLDPVDNYMTYSNDNRCRTRFTTGQVDKMKYTFETYRYSSAVTPGGGITTGGSDVGCFSDQSTVDVLHKGQIPISKVQIGDYVRCGNGGRSRIISLGHADDATEATYLQIHAKGLEKPLEITSSHMLFVSGKSALASQVKVGDMLGEHPVTKIKTVKRRGVYAPVTYSGDILVSGVLASCYVSLLDGLSARLLHPASHAAMTVYRMMCYYDFGLCQNETYINGISDRFSFAIRFVSGVNNFNGILQASAFLSAMPVILVLHVVEVLTLHSLGLIASVLFLFTIAKFRKLECSIKGTRYQSI